MREITVEQYDGNNRKVLWGDGSRSFLRYPKWYSANAEIEIGENIYYYNYSLFGRSLKLYDTQGTILLTEMYSNGNAILTIHDSSEKAIYRFICYGSDSALKNAKGKELITINSRFSWKELWNVTTVLCNEDFADTDMGKIFLILCLHHHYGRE